ncbi:MAG: protein kinase [Sandaracinaceae bacterium]|nr:protein kinase [Sandaracinaceae bacterium]
MREGARVGPYVLGPLLAEGGMARVHAATSVESGQRVALKLPTIPAGGLDDDLIDQVRHEVQAMARLSHPHVVPILDWGSAPDGQLYLAMPLIEDRTLREIATELDERGLLALVDQLLDALAYAHDRGVVHRDVKARNLLVAGDVRRPHVWLTDFGIASLDAGGRLRERPRPARHADVHGARAAPRRPRRRTGGRPLLRRSAALPPLRGPTPLRRQHRRGGAREPRARSAPALHRERALRDPRGSAEIVARLLDDDPVSRFPSGSSLRKALAALTAPAARARGAAVCLECGEPLPPGHAFCPVCDTGAPTIVDSEPSSASLATHEARAVTTLAVRTDAAHAGVVLSLLERAGAHVRWAEEGLAIAALGVHREPGLVEAAELALSLGAMGARVGLAPGTARLGTGSVLELDAREAVELAARAERGAVRASTALADRLATSHALEIDAGALRVRAMAQPSVAAMSDARLGPLLDAAREVARDGRARGITLVAGAGMGKSLALTELADRLEEEGWTCIAGAPSVEGDPLGVVRAAVRGWAGVWPGASRAAISSELAARLGDRELAARAAAAVAESGPLEPGVRARSLDALGGLFAALADRGPISIAVDDVASMDETSRELVQLLLERLADRPLLVVLAAREEQGGLEGTAVVPLPPLGEDDARALLSDVSDTGERASLLRLAEGHPGRLLELARLRRSAAPLPESAGAIARARLDALDEADRSVVRLAAIAGPRFWLAQLLAMSEEALGERALKLTREQIFTSVTPTSIAGTRELAFASDALRELAERSVPPERALALHARAARWLEQNALEHGAIFDTIAAHWEAAGDERRAAAWAVRAGRRAEALGAMRDALERYRRALAKLDRSGRVESSLAADGSPLPVDVPGLLSAICRVAVTSGEIDVAREAAERALSVDEPPRALVRGQARAALAEIARMAGEPERALAVLEAALADLGGAGDRILRAQLHARRGWILGYVLGRNDEGCAEAETALRLLDGLDVPAIESHIYSELGANELRAGRWDRQLECNLRALALAKQAGELPGQVRAHINLSVCYTNRGRLAEAAEHAIEAAATGLRAGLHRSRIVALNNLGIVRLDLGELEEAQRLLELVIELCARHGIRDILHETLPTLGRVLPRGARPRGRAAAGGRGERDRATRGEHGGDGARRASARARVHGGRRSRGGRALPRSGGGGARRGRRRLRTGDHALDARARAGRGHGRARARAARARRRSRPGDPPLGAALSSGREVPLEELAVLVGDRAGLVGLHRDAGDHDASLAHRLFADPPGVLEGRALVADARDAHLQREIVAEAHGPLEVRFGVHGGPAHAIHVEAVPIGEALLVEEVLERAVEEVEEARVVDDLRVIFVAEADAQPGGEGHRAAQYAGAPRPDKRPRARGAPRARSAHAASRCVDGGLSAVVLPSPRESSRTRSCAWISVR